jgi:biopolymer transport protein TolQ
MKTRWLVVLISAAFAAFILVDSAWAQAGATGTASAASGATVAASAGAVAEATAEVDIGAPSIFARSLQGGPIVFSCLLILVSLSILSWAVVIAKFFYMARIQKTGDAFVKSFWDSRSLNDLNSRLAEYPYSPAREVFRSGYAELVRGSQLRDQTHQTELAFNAAIDNLNRSLGKAKLFERRRMERFMSLLAITASASPFIGLFGTVWGIMSAFEGIARTGSASLAAVAPGISEALIATAFGLAAAIPAVIGYNMFAAKVRGQMIHIDGFTADFLNIVERYLVTDRGGGARQAAGGAGAAQPQPLGERI